MKKLYLLLFAFLIAATSFGQLLLDENFDYGSTAGNLTTVTGNWTGFSGASPYVGYATTSLSMATYPSSDIGGSATVSGASEDAQRLFSSVNSGTVYAGALVNISSVAASGTYFYSLRDAAGLNYFLRLYAQNDTFGKIVFGLREGSDGTVAWGTTSFELNTTYLLILKYDFTAGEATLYVLDSVVATEGAATAELTASDSANPTDLGGIAFRQASGSPNATIDGIRVGITWDDVMTVSTDPLIEVGSAVSGLDYEVGNGPSSEGSFTVQGSNLTDDILITAPSDFEISETSGGTFTPTVTLSKGSGTVPTTNIYVRLKAGLSIAIDPSYSGDAMITSSGAVSQSVSLEGSVYPPLSKAMTITGIFDNLSGSAPKGIEVYVISAIADLSIYGAGIASNGNGGGAQEFTFPAISASAGDYIYIVNSGHTAAFNAFFENAIVPYEDADFNFNGDDAVELYESGQIIDYFGDVNTDGTGEAWEYTDGWGYRNTEGPTTPFSSSEWNYSGIGNLDGATNATSTSPFPIGTYESTVLSTYEFSRSELSVYPNPTSLGYINISSKSQTAMKVGVYDILGKQVINETVSNNRLDVSNLTTGIYIMKISQDDATTTKKLVIK